MKTETVEVASNDFLTELANLRQELKNLTVNTGSSYKGSTMISTGTGSIDITTEQDPTKLAALIGTARIQEKLYNEGYQELVGPDGEYPVFLMSNTLVADIIENCKFRFIVINSASRKKELEDLIKEGEQFITEAEKKQNFMEKLSKKKANLLLG